MWLVCCTEDSDDNPCCRASLAVSFYGVLYLNLILIAIFLFSNLQPRWLQRSRLLIIGINRSSNYDAHLICLSAVILFCSFYELRKTFSRREYIYTFRDSPYISHRHELRRNRRKTSEHNADRVKSTTWKSIRITKPVNGPRSCMSVQKYNGNPTTMAFQDDLPG